MRSGRAGATPLPRAPGLFIPCSPHLRTIPSLPHLGTTSFQRVTFACSVCFILEKKVQWTIFENFCFLLFSRSIISNSLQPHEHQPPPSFTISWSLLKPMSTESVMPSNHLILCRPLLLLPSIFPSITVFSNKSILCIRWPKCWSFSISPFNEYSGPISFKIDWIDLLAFQGTLKNLLQHHSSKASILWHSAFYMVQLSHPYMTTGKTRVLTALTLLAKSYFCFLICCVGLLSYSSKEQVSFHFVAIVTIHIHFGAQENET